MKNNHIKRGILMMGIVFIATISLGCRKEDVTSEDKVIETKEPNGALEFDDVVMEVGSIDVTYREVLFYMLQLKAKYQDSFGTDIWDYEIEKGKTFEQLAKQEVIDQITELKVIKQEAKKLEVTLSDDELDEIRQNVQSYLSNITKKDQETYGITTEMVMEVLSDHYLADKVFTIATNEVNTNISDSEAKQIKVQQLFILTSGKDKNNNEVHMNEEQKQQAKKRAEQLLREAKEAEDFALFAKKNTDIDEVELIIGKEDEKDISEAAFQLKTGQISSLVETKNGYAILYCVNDFDKEATRAKKEELILKRQDEVFRKKYQEWSSQYKTDLSKRWSKISF